MSIAALVIVAEVGTALFFALYLGALTIGLREDRDLARVPVLDATGRALFSAAKYGFAAGILAVEVLTILNIAGSVA
jgi:energy-converting hydrogenase Eha subunit G